MAGGGLTFAVGHSLNSTTESIKYVATNYLGTGDCFTIIDTPGAQDSQGSTTLA